MEMIPVKKLADLLGCTSQSIRTWVKSKRIKPSCYENRGNDVRKILWFDIVKTIKSAYPKKSALKMLDMLHISDAPQSTTADEDTPEVAEVLEETTAPTESNVESPDTSEPDEDDDFYPDPVVTHAVKPLTIQDEDNDEPTKAIDGVLVQGAMPSGNMKIASMEEVTVQDHRDDDRIVSADRSHRLSEFDPTDITNMVIKSGGTKEVYEVGGLDNPQAILDKLKGGGGIINDPNV